MKLLIAFLSLMAMCSCGTQVAIPAYQGTVSLTPFGPSVSVSVAAHTDTFGTKPTPAPSSPASSLTPSK